MALRSLDDVVMVDEAGRGEDSSAIGDKDKDTKVGWMFDAG